MKKVYVIANALRMFSLVLALQYLDVVYEITFGSKLLIAAVCLVWSTTIMIENWSDANEFEDDEDIEEEEV